MTQTYRLMKKLFFLLFLLLFPFVRGNAQAVAINDTTRATFYCEEEGIRICLDMGKESLTVPGMPFLGKVHAYMNGKIYGIWMLTKRERKGDTAILRFTNDIGSDSQTVELKPLPDGTYQYTALEGNNVRRVKGRKLIKVPDTMVMKRSRL